MPTVQVPLGASALPSPLRAVLPLPLYDAILRSGAPAFEEIRLRSGRAASVTAHGKCFYTSMILNDTELGDILKKMCGGSLYAYCESINQGYLTMEGGIRVGVCGCAAVENGRVIGVSRVTSLNVRIPHAVTVCVDPILDWFFSQPLRQGMLLYAPPGGGKTTVLRSLAAALSSPRYNLCTVAVDTREELGVTLADSKLNLDILVGYPKRIGIEIAVRSLGAGVILCDEIGDEEDARAILSAVGCGVPLIATAHAADPRELLCRPTFASLHRAHAFGAYVGLTRREDNAYFFRFTPCEESGCMQVSKQEEE